MAGMKTDSESIRQECREIGTLLRAFEASAVLARGGTDEGAWHAALGEVRRLAGTIGKALDRVAQRAARRDPTRAAGIPDPVVDLDQDPQD